MSGLVAILVWNQAQEPAPVFGEQPARDLARVNLPCSWRRGLRALVLLQARAARLTANAFVEALLARELRAPEAVLILRPRRGTAKPRLK